MGISMRLLARIKRELKLTAVKGFLVMMEPVAVGMISYRKLGYVDVTYAVIPSKLSAFELQSVCYMVLKFYKNLTTITYLETGISRATNLLRLNWFNVRFLI